MKNLFLIIALFQITGTTLFAQVSITPDNSAPDNSAMFDVKSTNKGMLVPRMTQAEIEAIASPANGLMVFCTTHDKFFVYLSSQNKWQELAYGPYSINPGGFNCGNTIAIHHVPSGGVAPVDIYVTYGTVTDIPGEPAKCWITSNLGADHQATAVNEATEASAGWYWQFNRRQGYKHDGAARTPNSAWIDPITETSDWLPINDPCALELGTTWHLPTYTEWFNVDNIGGWTTWLGPFTSPLKLHAAGILHRNTGSLLDRGIYGYYWSNIKYDATLSWALNFLSSSSDVVWGCHKTYGFSVRCVRDN